MSADGQPSREVAHRLFAAEFEDAALSYSESDDERAPNYVVTPTGARVNRLFVVGVLTEIEEVGSEQLRARIVDPTGAFVVYAGQYQPDALATLDGLSAPEFVAVTGKARTFQPEDSERVYTSIRPETIATVDATVRDRWTVRTAERTLDRVRTAIDAHGREERGDDLREALGAEGVSGELAAGVPLAFEHYGTTTTYLGAVGDLALDAARVVAGEREEVGPLDTTPDEGGASERSSDEFAGIDAGTVATAAATGEAETASAATDDTDDASVTADSEGAMADSGGSAAGTDADTESDVPSESESTTATTTTTTTTGGDDRAGADPGPAGGSGEDREPVTGGTADEPSGGEETAADDGPVGGTPDTTELTESDAGEAADATDTEVAESTDEAIDPDDPEEFELDPEERDRLETEFGTEFERGSEVDEPGAADIETPDAGETDAGDADEPTADEPETDIDLEDAVMDAMETHDDGEGAEREAVIESVAEEHGVGAEAVDDAIDEALMDGRCYKTDEGVVKPI